MKLFALICAAAVAAFLLWVPLQLAGDGVEYISVSEAWRNHGSPDIRAGDLLWLEQGFGVDLGAVARLGIDDPHGGGQHGYHFWLYPLLVVPAAALLELSGANWLRAFQATNVALFAAAIGFAAFAQRAASRRRWVLIGLAAVGPVLWYLRWPHPEVFSWACALVSLVCLDNRRYPAAAAAAALGAMQNPPLVMLAIYAVVLAARAGAWRRTALTAAAAGLAALPAAFYVAVLGVPSPIAAVGWVDSSHISAARTWNLFTDLNQGLLPYVPVLLGMAAVAVVRGLWRRDGRVLGIAAVLLFMVLGVQTIYQWNSGSAGLIRYAVWMLPLLAWLAAEGLPDTRLVRGTAAVAVAMQALIVLGHGFGATLPICGFPVENGQVDIACHLVQRRLAVEVLSRWPQLYSPPADVFYCRQMHVDTAAPQIDRPAAFVRDDGVVTKLLVDARSVEQVPQRFAVDPPYRAEMMRRAAAEPGLFYLHPPRGAVTSFCPPQPLPAEAFRDAIDVAVRQAPASIAAPSFSVDVEITNRGAAPICNRATGGTHWFTLGYRVWEGGDMVVENGRRTLASDILQPGERAALTMRVALPRRTGRYVVEFLPVLEMVAWGARAARLNVDVVAASSDEFRANITAEPAAGALATAG